MSTHRKQISVYCPTMALRIGVIGSRDLENIDKQAGVTKAVNDVLFAIDSALYEVHTEVRSNSYHGVGSFYSDESPNLHVVSGLAEGVDSIAS